MIGGAKEYLQQVRNSDIAIKDKMQELADLEVLVTNVNSINEGDRVQSSSSQDKMADTVCKIADLKMEIQEEINNLLRLKREVRDTIEKVSEPDLVSILYKRYILFKKWEEISVELNVSYRHTTRLHGKALIEIEKILKMS